MNKFEKACNTLEFNQIRIMLSDLAATEGAKEEALRMLPSDSITLVKKLQLQTDDAKKLISVKGRPPFGNVRNIEMILEKAKKGAMLSPREILDVAGIYSSARSLKDYCKTNKTFDTVLDETFDLLNEDRRFENHIYDVIISDDMISDDASPELSDIRRKIKNANNKIKDVLHKYTSGAFSKYLQENIVTIRDGRYVIPVKIEYKNEIKGVVHDTSASGSTLFIEPMSVVDENNRLRELETAEQREIDKILYTLSGECADRSDDIKYNFQNINDLALIFAKALLSDNLGAIMPNINERHEFVLRKARHPLLNKDTVVPISVSLGGDWDTLVITGPNTGGKTVTLKTIGLFALMVQSGLQIPCAPGTDVCIFNNVLVDIGDEQSIEQSLSTFSAHMVNIVEILKEIDSDSLVLFDELGAGTDPVEGAALAMSILECTREKKVLCAATTHYAELKMYALDTDGVTNASCEFDIETLKPTYKLIIGTPGRSNAFAISSKLGLDSDIVDKAKDYVSKDNKQFEYVIDKLEEKRIKFEREYENLLKEKEEFDIWKKEKEEAILKNESRAQKELERAEQKAQTIMQGAKLSSDYVLRELDEIKKKQESSQFASHLEKARDKIREELRNADEKYNPINEVDDNESYVLPRDLVVGDNVLICDIGQQGVVKATADKKGRVLVSCGMLSMRTDISNLRLINDEITVKTSDGRFVDSKTFRDSVSAGVSPELDVRGQNGEDAWFMCDKYLDDAKVAGLHMVTIIHGKGTGILKNVIRKNLKRDKRVKSFREGVYGEGDGGVTVVEIK